MNGNDKINYVNMGLMLVSAVAAFIMPFELFLFSYAVLGPLHYLTEISWLQKSGYYIKSKNDPWILIICGVIATVAFLNVKVGEMHVGEMVVGIAFLASFFMVVLSDMRVKIAAIAGSILVIVLVSDQAFYQVFFGIFLPTLIHVFVFTGLFIIYGALKSKSISGYLSMVFFLLCASSFLWLGTDWSIYLSEAARKKYDFLLGQNFMMLRTFDALDGVAVKADLFQTSAAIILMRFIAFAYTYHYLNWFSKTNVIKWHDIPKQKMALILLIWVVAVGLYLYNYKHGLKLLYFLSMVHVFLEFPLNFRTVSGIGSEIGKRLGMKTKTA